MNKITILKSMVLGSLISMGILISGCSDNFTSPSAPNGTTIADVIVGQDSLKAFAAAINKIGLYANFDNVNGGQFTMFAPTNYSFIKYLRLAGLTIGAVTPASAGDSATKVINKLTVTSTPLSISGLVTRINYHIISSAVPSGSITGAQGFTTMNGARLSLSIGSTTPFLINANVGAGLNANGANILDNGTVSSNGVVYMIDRVMAPIPTASSGLLSFFKMGIDYTKAVADPAYITVTAGNTTNYDVLCNALKKTQLITTLVPNGSPLPDYTVFAPDDANFVTFLQTLNANVIDEPTAITFINSLNGTTTPSLSAFTDILKYHVVSGRVLSTDFTTGTAISTLLTGKTFSVDASTFVITDGVSTVPISASKNNLTNAGIVHVISGVLQHN